MSKIEENNFDYSQLEVSKRATIFGKVVAVLLAALGLYLPCMIIPAIWKMVTSGDPLSHVVFLLFFAIPSLLFTGYCFFVAYQTWMNICPKIVRRTSLVAAIILFLTIGGIIEHIFEDSIWLRLTTPLCLILAGGFHILFSKLLLKWLGLQEVIDWVKREKSTTTFLAIAAFLMWGACMVIIEELALNSSGFSHLPKEAWWSFFILFAPLVVIYSLYKASLRIVLRNKPVDVLAKE